MRPLWEGLGSLSSSLFVFRGCLFSCSGRLSRECREWGGSSWPDGLEFGSWIPPGPAIAAQTRSWHLLCSPAAGHAGMLRFGVPGDALVWGSQGLGSLGMLWVPEDAHAWGPWGCLGLGSLGFGSSGLGSLGSPGMLWIPEDAQAWGPQGWSRFGVPEDAQVWGPQGCCSLGSLGMLWILEDAQAWGPQGYSDLGSPGMLQFRAGSGGDASASPQQDAAPEAAVLGVEQSRDASEDRVCRGTFFALLGAGVSTRGQLLPRSAPGGWSGSTAPPQPLGGAEIHVLGRHNASAFPFHPLPVPVPFQPETWVSLLFWVGFLAAFFYYFNLGTVIIFSII